MKISALKCNNIQAPVPVFAWAIKIIQKMKPWSKDSYSHMAIKAEDEEGNVFFVDANAKETMRRVPEEFFKQYEILEEHTFEKQVSLKDFNEWYAPLDGSKYDWKQIGGLLLKFLGVISFNKYGNNYKKLICCELIINYLERFQGIEVVDSDSYDLLLTWKIIKRF